MDIWIYLFYIISALSPSIIWLLFYLIKDQHPEPKNRIIKVFFWGVIAAVIAGILESKIIEIIGVFFPLLVISNSLWFLLLKYFILVALIEELAKYLSVRRFVLHNAVVDEPLDVMLYIIVSALGFATLENFLLLFNLSDLYKIVEILEFSAERFIGAIFLHTLASGVLGFFWALSLYGQKNKKLLFSCGVFIAIFMHGLYNFSVANFTGFWRYSICVFIIIFLAIFTTLAFIKLKKLSLLTLNDSEQKYKEGN